MHSIDWKTQFSSSVNPRPRVSFGSDFNGAGLDFTANDIPFGEDGAEFGASANDVVQYRNLWTPYVMEVVGAARGDADVLPETKQFAEDIAASWDAYAGTSPAELLYASDNVLKHFQTVVKDAVLLDSYLETYGYEPSTPPDPNQQSAIISSLEGAGLITRGALQVLGVGFTPKGIGSGLGVIANEAGKALGETVGAAASGVGQGAGSVAKGVGQGVWAFVSALGVPMWVWVAGGALAVAVLPKVLVGHPLVRLITRR